MPNHEKRTLSMFTSFCVDCQFFLYKCDIDAKCCNFLLTYFTLLSFPMKDIYTKKRQFKFDDVIYKPNHENRTH